MSKDDIPHNHLPDGLLQDKSFVIRFGSEASPSQNPFAGRVKHLHSGQATQFQSLSELVAFVDQILASVNR